MGNYVVVDDVLDYLFITFEVSDPTNFVNKFRTWIDNRINEMEIKLEEKCRTAWRAVTVTEYFKRTWAWQFAEGKLRHPIIPSYQPLRTVNSLEVDLGSGFQLMSEGTDYIVRNNEILLVRRIYPSWSTFNTIKVNYTYGHSTVPADVKGAVIRMVVIEMFTTANMQPFIQKIPNEKTIEYLQKYVDEVIARYMNPQLVPR